MTPIDPETNRAVLRFPGDESLQVQLGQNLLVWRNPTRKHTKPTKGKKENHGTSKSALSWGDMLVPNGFQECNWMPEKKHLNVDPKEYDIFETVLENLRGCLYFDELLKVFVVLLSFFICFKLLCAWKYTPKHPLPIQRLKPLKVCNL